MTALLGEVIYASVKPIFKIYFIVGIGYWLARKNILTVDTCRNLSDAIVTAILPCLIFYNIVLILQSSDIKYIGIVFFEGTILYTTGGLLALLTYYVCKSPKRWFGGLISVGMFPNISDLPIAYLQTLSKTGSLFTVQEGNKGVAYVCIFLASQVFFQFSLGLYRLIQYDFRDQLSDEEYKDSENQSEDKLIRVTNEIAHGDGKTETNGEGSLVLLAVDDCSMVPLDLKARQIGSAGSSHTRNLDINSCNCNQSVFGLQSMISEGRSISSGHQSSCFGRQSSRSLDPKRNQSQDIDDVINAYSEFHRLRSHEVVPPLILPSDIAVEPVEVSPPEDNPNTTSKIITYLHTMLKNFSTPNSLSLIISLIIAMAPPLKALFVPTSFRMPNAPDQQPPLSFVMDITSYVGAACVPIGLLLLGATIARLKVKNVVEGFWKTVVMITACRLIIVPIFGVGFTTGIAKAGWFDGNDLLRLVSVLEFGLPNATTLIYLTAFHTDPLSEEHLQMDCLALCLIAQYCILFITLPILVTFTLKVSLQM